MKDGGSVGMCRVLKNIAKYIFSIDFTSLCFNRLKINDKFYFLSCSGAKPRNSNWSLG